MECSTNIPRSYIFPVGVYEDFYENKDLFDFSVYPEDSKLFNPVKKKLLVKMKDEVKGKINSESVGLKSKMYSLVIVVSEKNLKSKWSQ